MDTGGGSDKEIDAEPDRNWGIGGIRETRASYEVRVVGYLRRSTADFKSEHMELDGNASGLT
jgi:hypothetical protein